MKPVIEYKDMSLIIIIVITIILLLYDTALLTIAALVS